MTEYEKWLKDNGVKYLRNHAHGYASYGDDMLRVLRENNYDVSKPFRNYRQEACGEFGFAIPSEEALKKLAALSPILEVGAGTGYWTHELRKLGATVYATDPHPYKGFAVDQTKTWCEVEPLTALDAIEKYRGVVNTILFVWPSMEQWPTDALSAFGGEYAVHVGENGGCTATETFFEELDNHWTEIDEVAIPTWECVRDRCFIYKRK